MDETAKKLRVLVSIYYNMFNKDPKCESFKLNIIPTLLNLKCFFCKQSFSCEYSLKRHYTSLHLDELPIGIFKSKEYRCNVCKKIFNRQDKLNDHVNNSNQHKQAVLSQQNLKGTIKDLFESKSQKRKDRTEDNDEESIVPKKQKTDQISESNASIEKNVGANEINKSRTEQRTENDQDIYFLKELKPDTEQFGGLDKEDLLKIRKKIIESYYKLQKQYNLVKEHLKKFD